MVQVECRLRVRSTVNGGAPLSGNSEEDDIEHATWTVQCHIIELYVRIGRTAAMYMQRIIFAEDSILLQAEKQSLANPSSIFSLQFNLGLSTTSRCFALKERENLLFFSYPR